MIYRKFNAPNVEYNEIDRSQYGLINDGAAVGTMTFIAGFADKGDDYDAKYSRSLPDFINTYGYPTNEAERYFYNAAKEVFAHGGRTITSKIPYDNESKDKFAYTVYSSNGVVPLNSAELSLLSSVDPTITSCIELKSIGKENFQSYLSSIGSVDRSGLMTIEEYDALLVGSRRPEENSFFIVDIARNRYSKDPNFIDLLSDETDSYLGFVPVVVSPWNALYFQNLIDISAAKEFSPIEELPTDGSIDTAMVVDKINELIDRENGAEDSIASFNVVKHFQTIPNTGYEVPVEIELAPIDIDTLFENELKTEVVGRINGLVMRANTQGEAIDPLPTDGSPTLRLIVDKVNELVRHFNASNDGYDDPSSSEGAMNKLPPLSAVYSHFAQPLASTETVSETVSKVAAKYFPSIRFLKDDRLDRTYLKQIGVVVFKMVADPSNDGLINFVPVESFIGSLDRRAKDPVTGKNLFIDEIVNASSQTINLFSNFNFQDIATVSYGDGGTDKQVVASALDKASIIRISDQTVTSLGFFVSQCSKFVSRKIIEDSLDLVFENCKDPNAYPLDIVCDGGVSNIAQYMDSLEGKTLFYEPEFDFNGEYSLLNSNSTTTWKKILKKYDDFVRYSRKDCIFVADGMRPLCLTGNEKVVRKSAPKNSIVKDIIPKIRYMLPPNSSYSAGYCDWFKCVDDTSQSYFWCPPSIKAVGIYLYTDRYANTWDAPAGDNRGKVLDAYDIAFNPTVEEAQSFYEQQWNYAMSYPLNGIVLEGQKTFQTDRTALDRVNVRRLCNGIKKGIKEIARWFKYEGITPQILTRFRDQLTEFLQKVQLNNGISEFFIKLDDENNTPETADRNEIHAAIAIRPVKTAEFIVINSIVVNQSADLEEVTNSVLA